MEGDRKRQETRISYEKLGMAATFPGIAHLAVPSVTDSVSGISSGTRSRQSVDEAIEGIRRTREIRDYLHPCCCGGTIVQWAKVISSYEIVVWIGMIILKIIQTLTPIWQSYRERNSPEIQDIFVVVEVGTYGLGAGCGVILMASICTKSKVCCIAHSVMCTLDVIAIGAVITLIMYFDQDLSKWNYLLAYFGFIFQQIYFAFFSYGLYGYYRKKMDQAFNLTLKNDHDYAFESKLRRASRDTLSFENIPEIVVSEPY